MNDSGRRFLSVFTLVSRIPVKASFTPDYSRTDFWLPLIGPLASAAALAGLFAGWIIFGDPLLAALCALALQYAAFNLFHFDGLLDTADAMLPWAENAKRLEILKDPRIGAYALASGFLSLAAKAAAIAKLLAGSGATGSGAFLPSGTAIAALLAFPAAGRAAAAFVPLSAAPARPDGLGALMRGFSLSRLLVGFLLALVPLALWASATGSMKTFALAAIAAALAAPLSGLAMAKLYRKRVGGFTGDALGAAVEIGELSTLLLFTAAAGWIGRIA